MSSSNELSTLKGSVRVLDLFSGIGGFSIGLERAGMKTVAFCEIEKFPQSVLKKHWPHVPIYDDIRTLTADGLRSDGIGTIDVICGGFPCQDISNAGKCAGITGERSGLWKEYARLISELRPRYVIVENVAALLSRGLGVVLGDLAAIGYDAEWHCIPASSVGMGHGRDRLWIVAYATGEGWSGVLHNFLSKFNQQAKEEQTIALDTSRAFDSRARGEVYGESPFFRGNYGLPNRVDRLKALGNAVVPQIPELIGRAIMENYNE